MSRLLQFHSAVPSGLLSVHQCRVLSIKEWSKTSSLALQRHQRYLVILSMSDIPRLVRWGAVEWKLGKIWQDIESWQLDYNMTSLELLGKTTHILILGNHRIHGSK